MRVKSKLADIDFQFGEVRRDGSLLVIASHADSKMKSTVYVSPQDVVEFLKRFLISPTAIVFVLALPYFLYKWKRSSQNIAQTRRRVTEWPKV
jgi:hypothetical protein